MKKLLISTSVAAIALSFASIAGAQSLSDTIGGGVIDQMNQFDTANLINRAVNNHDIDGSVNIIGAPNLYSSTSIDAAVDIGASLDLGLQASGGIALPGILVGAAEAGLAIDAHLLANISLDQVNSVGGALVNSTKEIKTLAAGAVNTGHIATAVEAASSASNVAANISLTDLEYLDGEVSSASAHTSNTGAEAFAAEGTYASLGSLGLNFTQSTSEASSGPASGVYAVNEAFNMADINGSVNILSNGTNLAGISTLAAGAINTGTISLGFDGAGLNSAINGGGN